MNCKDLRILRADIKTVFIVDDEEAILELIEMELEELDIKLYLFTSIEQAIKASRGIRVDLIIIDFFIDGRSILSLMPEDMFCNTPKIFMSGFLKKEIMDKVCFEYFSVIGFLVKPFTDSLIEQVVSRHLFPDLHESSFHELLSPNFVVVDTLTLAIQDAQQNEILYLEGT